MSGVLAVASREFKAYFSTPLGWVCLGAWLLITGFFFGWSMDLYSAVSLQTASNPFGDPIDLEAYLIAPFFGNWAVVLIFLCPALSMRLFAEERHSGSFSLLRSSGLTSTQLVLGKYLGAMAFVGVALAATLHYPLFLMRWAEPDLGVLFACYLGMFLLSASFMAVGLVASSMSSSQVVALLSAFAILMVLWIMGLGEGAQDQGWRDWISDVSMLPRVQPMLRGLIHGADVAYFISVIALLLFVAQQRLELERWQ